MRLLAQSQRSGSSHPPHAFFILNVHFGRTLLRGSLTSVSSPLVSLVSNVCGTIRNELCSMRSTRSKMSSNAVNKQANDEHTPRNIRRWYGDNTYCSLTTPEFVPFIRGRLTCTTSRVGALLHWSESLYDRYWNDLKQQAQEMRSNRGTPQNSHIWYDTYHCQRPLPTALGCVCGYYWQNALEQYQPGGPNVISQQHVVA